MGPQKQPDSNHPRATDRPGRQLGVVACVEGPAAAAGVSILQAGGNAAEAALATAFAQGVVDPIYCGIGGNFSGLFYDVRDRRSLTVTSSGRAPRAARADMWTPKGRWGNVWTVDGDRNRYGYEASLVPGFLRGAQAAFEQFGSGRIGWRDLIEPALSLANDGFAVYPYLYRLWMPNTQRMRNFLESGDGPTLLSQTEECKRIYLKNGTEVYEIGDVLVQKDYARTLERVAAHGADDFYDGEIARRIADDFERHGGLITLKDLREYQAEIAEPLEGTYGDLHILTEPPPSVGPAILEIFNIVEGLGLGRLGWNSVQYLDLLARAMRVGLGDRMTLAGDPAFVDVPWARILSKEYAADVRRKLISETTSTAKGSRGASLRDETTHVSVIDQWGNAAAITHSLGMSSGVVTPGLGFQYNCQMMMFDPDPGRPNSIAPWKRPLSGGGPVLVLRGGSPWIAIGSPGGTWKVTGIVQAVLNMTEFGMTAQQAVAVDRIHVEHEPHTIFVEPHFPPDTLLGLARLGHRIRFEWYTARLCAVSRDVKTGRLEAGSDPRGGRGAAVA